MILIGMLRAGKTELICDLAETYGVYDYRALPVETLATLCVGLRDNSRIKMKLSGMAITPELLIEAIIADRLGTLVWINSKDGENGRNFPESIAAKLLGEDRRENDIEAFDTAEAFEDAWARMTGGTHADNS